MHELTAYLADAAAALAWWFALNVLPLLVALYACYRALKAGLTALFK